MFQSHYDVGGHKFANIFQAFDRSIETGQFCYYKIDQNWIDQLESIRVRYNTNSKELQKIYIKKLELLRKQHNKLVLLYTGGTDSHTILDLAIKNKIYIDEVFMSFPGIFDAESDKVLNQEYNVALEFVKKNIPSSIGKIKLYKWTIEDYKYLDVKDWWKNPKLYQHNKIKFQPCWAVFASEYYKNLNGIIITGHEKPGLRFKDNKFYWFVTDTGTTEHKIIKKTFPFFLDPEIVVFYAHQLKKLLQNKLDYFTPIQDRYDFFWKLPDSNIKKFYKSLGLTFLSFDSIQWTKKPSWGTHHNYKNQGILKSLKKTKQKKILNKILTLHNSIYQQYKNFPYMVTTDSNLVKTVERYSQMFEITNNSLICRGHDI
jgi:hypothetical protein